jgi:hypothetical protein
MKKKMDDFNCLLSMPNLGKYVGKWIVIVNNKVVSTGTVGKEVYAEAKEKYPDSKPLLMKVPSETVMLL